MATHVSPLIPSTVKTAPPQKPDSNEASASSVKTTATRTTPDVTRYEHSHSDDSDDEGLVVWQRRDENSTMTTGQKAKEKLMEREEASEDEREEADESDGAESEDDPFADSFAVTEEERHQRQLQEHRNLKQKQHYREHDEESAPRAKGVTMPASMVSPEDIADDDAYNSDEDDDASSVGEEDDGITRTVAEKHAADQDKEELRIAIQPRRPSDLYQNRATPSPSMSMMQARLQGLLRDDKTDEKVEQEPTTPARSVYQQHGRSKSAGSLLIPEQPSLTVIEPPSSVLSSAMPAHATPRPTPYINYSYTTDDVYPSRTYPAANVLRAGAPPLHDLLQNQMQYQNEGN